MFYKLSIIYKAKIEPPSLFIYLLYKYQVNFIPGHSTNKVTEINPCLQRVLIAKRKGHAHKAVMQTESDKHHGQSKGYTASSEKKAIGKCFMKEVFYLDLGKLGDLGMQRLAPCEEEYKTTFYDFSISKSIQHDHQLGNHSLDHIQFNLPTLNCALVIYRISVKSMGHAK